MTEQERFVLIENNEEFPITETSRWYWDTKRSLKGSSLYQPYVAIQCYTEENPADRKTLETKE